MGQPLSPGGRRFLPLLSLALLLVGTATATSVYSVNLSIGSTGHVTGNIVTDGAIGVLTAGDFLDWNITITDGVHTPATLKGPLSGNNSTVSLNGTEVTATATALFFNFSAPAAEDAYFFFEDALGNFVCFGGGGAGGYSGNCALSQAGNVKAISLGGANQSTLLTGTQIVASPEPASLILLSGGLVLLGIKKALHRKSRNFSA